MPISALDFRYPVICSAFARLSFLHWFRDQLRPGRHNFKFFDRFVFLMRFWFVRKALMTTLGVRQVPISPRFALLVQATPH